MRHETINRCCVSLPLCLTGLKPHITDTLAASASGYGGKVALNLELAADRAWFEPRGLHITASGIPKKLQMTTVTRVSNYNTEI
jgi:hypothetical protein